jgi:malate synthase
VRHGRAAQEDVLTIVREEADVATGQPHLGEATRTFEQVALADDFVEFLTLPAYALLD